MHSSRIRTARPVNDLSFLGEVNDLSFLGVVVLSRGGGTSTTTPQDQVTSALWPWDLSHDAIGVNSPPPPHQIWQNDRRLWKHNLR